MACESWRQTNMLVRSQQFGIWNTKPFAWYSWQLEIRLSNGCWLWQQILGQSNDNEVIGLEGSLVLWESRGYIESVVKNWGCLHRKNIHLWKFFSFESGMALHQWLSIIIQRQFMHNKCVCTCLSFWSKHWCLIGRAQPTMAMAW